MYLARQAVKRSIDGCQHDGATPDIVGFRLAELRIARGVGDCLANEDGQNRRARREEDAGDDFIAPLIERHAVMPGRVHSGAISSVARQWCPDVIGWITRLLSRASAKH